MKITAKKFIIAILIILLYFGLIFIFSHNSIDSALKRAKPPFEAGEVIFNLQLDDNLTVVFYRNLQDNSLLQNIIVQKYGPIYKAISHNGSLSLVKPKKLKTGELRSNMLCSWFDKKDQEKCIVMVVANDENIESVVMEGKSLSQVNFDGYKIFLGFVRTEGVIYSIFDGEGNELGHYV